MKKLTKILAIGAVVAVAGTVGWHALADSPMSRPGFGPGFMHGPGAGMMGPAHGMTGMRHDSATMAQMGVVHQLIINHDSIKRTVTNTPDGIRTVTESDNPKIAQLLKDHAATMIGRVGEGSDPGLPIESQALHGIFRDKDKIHTTVETTANGVVVVQTSNDPKVVTELQQHASEVSDLVHGGMAALHTAMAKNGGMMQHAGFGGPMMMQNGGTR
ncbi:MAG: hypothetical protein KGJ66_15190 [Alphaproteobacteria bacterium]|nr:hypothetical protein [Alphaproteobacteria bacterium]